MSESLEQGLASTIGRATSGWRKAMRNADRENRPRSYASTYVYSDRVTIKGVAFRVMEEAFNKASSNGRYYANARQIFYAARPLILAEATAEKIESQYFTQTLLKDYIENMNPNWKIVWDARGHFREPFSDKSIGVGGADVEEYIRGWRDPDTEFDTPSMDHTIGTKGPKGRYHGVLFIEKEGFDQLLEEEHFAERFDIAIMSTKGIPVKAACDLLETLGEEIPVYVAHDFDKAGFTIIETLRRGTRLARGREVIDLGLRLADAEGLESEEVHERWRGRYSAQNFLSERGATKKEIDFLLSDQRIELNAMTSEQFIEWLNRALIKAGAKKLLPDSEMLRAAYRRAMIGKRFEEKIEELENEMEDKEQGIKIPKGLRKQIQEKLKDDPGRSWDSVIWELAENGDDKGEGENIE
jgi:hypothetical protein